MSGIPQTTKEFYQFTPSTQEPDYPGVLGWGFDTNNFRIVVFTPEEFDHESVKDFYRQAKRPRLRVGEDANDELPPEYRIRTRDRRAFTLPHKPPKMPERGEHPPAHVHVYNLRSGHQARYELVSPQKGNDYMRPLVRGGKNDGNLTDEEREAVEPALDDTASLFIQFWQEIYQDKRLSGAVTRTTNVNGIMMDEHLENGKWLVQTHPHNKSRSKIPLPDLREKNQRRRHDDEHGR